MSDGAAASQNRARMRKSMVSTLGLLLATGGLSLAPPAAHADGERMKDVKRACAAGEVDKGVRLLADLYAETNDPTAIYNQARCYQQNARPELAASRFREYLRKAGNISAAERAEVDAFIREADAEAARRAAYPASATPAYPAPGAYPAAPAYPTAPAYPAGGAPRYPAAGAPGYPGANAAGYPPGYVYPAGYAPAATPAPVTLAGKPEAPVRRRKGLLIAGSITLGASYLVTVLTGVGVMNHDPLKNPDLKCTECDTVGKLYLLPVLGPWLAVPIDKDLRAASVLLGIGQGVGLTLAIIGYSSFSKSKPQAVAGLSQLRLGFAPTGGGGLGAVQGRF
jgi:hypothetical protein